MGRDIRYRILIDGKEPPKKVFKMFGVREEDEDESDYEKMQYLDPRYGRNVYKIPAEQKLTFSELAKKIAELASEMVEDKKAEAEAEDEKGEGDDEEEQVWETLASSQQMEMDAEETRRDNSKAILAYSVLLQEMSKSDIIHISNY